MAAPLIETIFLQGSDQIASQYKIDFPSGLPAGVIAPTDNNILILRLDKEFEIPRQQTYQYEVFYNGLKVPRTGPKDETEKMIKLDFRLDQNWEVYNILKSWMNVVYNDREGIAGDEIATRTTVRFTALAGDATNQTRVNKKVIEFFYSKPKSLGVSQFAQDSGDPNRVDIEMLYLYHNG